MFELLVEGITAYLGGYFSQVAQDEKISIKKFFLKISLLMMVISCLIQLIAGAILLNDFIFGLVLALIGATVLSLILLGYRKYKKPAR